MCSNRRPGTLGWTALLCTIAALSGVPAFGSLPGTEGPSAPSGVGKIARGFPAPDATFERLVGSPVRLSDLKGQAVVLDFWSLWCGPCLAELPHLSKVAQQYADAGVTFLAVNVDDPDEQQDKVSEYVAKIPEAKPFVVFATPKIASLYRVHVLPTLVAIDRGGKIIGVALGALSIEEPNDDVTELFRELASTDAGVQSPSGVSGNRRPRPGTRPSPQKP